MTSPVDYKPRLDYAPSKAKKSRLLLVVAGAFVTAVAASLLFSGSDQAEPTPQTASVINEAPSKLTIDLKIPGQQPSTVTTPQDIQSKTNEEVSVAIAPVADVATIEPKPSPFKKLEHTVKGGENLSIIFSKLDLSKKALHDIVSVNSISKELKSLRPGKLLTVEIDENRNIKRLVYAKNNTESIIASHSVDGFDVSKSEKQIDRHQSFAAGTIESSLFNDGKKAGMSDKTIMELANIFGWDIDFALDLREGDNFSILYEKQFIDGEEIGAGPILAAEFTNRGKTFRAVRFEDQKGIANYFTPEGDSMRKAFLRSPVDFARISSRFNLKRKHPVLNKIRAHKGVDYAARTGTPIKTTGDGKIIFRGWKGGYGRVVIVQHGQRYTTLYAHLSKFRSKQKKGSYVKQGQVIGYIGKSGLATGPHLHYEFRVNGVHRNPLTVKLPHAKPIQKKYLAAFTRHSQQMIAQLDQFKRVQLAQAAPSQ